MIKKQGYISDVVVLMGSFQNRLWMVMLYKGKSYGMCLYVDYCVGVGVFIRTSIQLNNTSL